MRPIDDASKQRITCDKQHLKLGIAANVGILVCDKSSSGEFNNPIVSSARPTHGRTVYLFYSRAGAPCARIQFARIMARGSGEANLYLSTSAVWVMCVRGCCGVCVRRAGYTNTRTARTGVTCGQLCRRKLSFFGRQIVIDWIVERYEYCVVFVASSEYSFVTMSEKSSDVFEFRRGGFYAKITLAT